MPFFFFFNQIRIHKNILCKQTHLYFLSLLQFLENIFFNINGMNCVSDVAKLLELPKPYWAGILKSYGKEDEKELKSFTATSLALTEYADFYDLWLLTEHADSHE